MKTDLITRVPFKYQKFRHLVSFFIRNNRLGIVKKNIVGKEYLDVGCGFNVHGSYINMDYYWHPELDVCWDITRGIPLPSNSIKGIFTEHCIEHITLEKMIDVLGEFKRLLAPGGTLRIIVPDGELYVKTYLKRHEGSSDNPFPYEFQDPIEDFYTPMMSLNRIFRKWGHLFIYDYQTLGSLLEHCGFVDIKQESYRSGRDPQLFNDTESRAHESLFVEASNPD